MKIAVVRGDGIGKEIIDGALRVLDVVSRHSFSYELVDVIAGGCAIDLYGEPLPQSELEKCLAADCVLLGAVGGPKWDGGKRRPEEALLGIRKALGLYANIRPARLYSAMRGACPLKDDGGFDLVILRELTGGIYYGDKGRKDKGKTAYDLEIYSEYEIERIAERAFVMAESRRGIVTSIDKANVLESSRLWRETVAKVGLRYPNVELRNMLVDNAAMQLVRNPSQFDVILTNNIFGDILSDLASQLTGSIGLLPSASLGESKGMYEPIHGSAPDIAGKGIANPIATILSVAMLLRESFGLKKDASRIERAVDLALEAGCRTADIAVAGEKTLSTEEMTERIISFLP